MPTDPYVIAFTLPVAIFRECYAVGALQCICDSVSEIQLCHCRPNAASEAAQRVEAACPAGVTD